MSMFSLLILFSVLHGIAQGWTAAGGRESGYQFPNAFQYQLIATVNGQVATENGWTWQSAKLERADVTLPVTTRGSKERRRANEEEESNFLVQSQRVHFAENYELLMMINYSTTVNSSNSYLMSKSMTTASNSTTSCQKLPMNGTLYQQYSWGIYRDIEWQSKLETRNVSCHYHQSSMERGRKFFEQQHFGRKRNTDHDEEDGERCNIYSGTGCITGLCFVQPCQCTWQLLAKRKGSSEDHHHHGHSSSKDIRFQNSAKQSSKLNDGAPVRLHASCNNIPVVLQWEHVQIVSAFPMSIFNDDGASICSKGSPLPNPPPQNFCPRN